MQRRVRIALGTVAAAAVAVTGAAALSACGTSASTAQAATTSQTAVAGQQGGQMGDPSSMLAQALDPLVSAGTITSDQEATVVSALASAMQANAPSGGQPPSQPSSGSTPPAQPSSDSTPPAVPSGGSGPQGGPAAMFSDTLAGLVSDGTITADQQTAIEEALSSAMPAPGGQPPSGAAPSGTAPSGGTATQSS